MRDGTEVFHERFSFEWVSQSVNVIVSIGAGFVLEVRLIRDLLVRVVGAVLFDRIFGRVEPEVVPPGRFEPRPVHFEDWAVPERVRARVVLGPLVRMNLD